MPLSGGFLLESMNALIDSPHNVPLAYARPMLQPQTFDIAAKAVAFEVFDMKPCIQIECPQLELFIAESVVHAVHFFRVWSHRGHRFSITDGRAAILAVQFEENP
jgi:hypothetical protein